MDNAKPAPADYEVTQAREIGGIWRDVGDPVQMMPRQAMYYTPPYGTGLKPGRGEGSSQVQGRC